MSLETDIQFFIMAKLRHKLIGLKRQCGEVSLNCLLFILSRLKNGDETEAERLFP